MTVAYKRRPAERVCALKVFAVEKYGELSDGYVNIWQGR